MTVMEITLNGTTKVLSTQLTLLELIQDHLPNHQRVIAEVNGEIVKNPRWNEIHIKEGDAIELVSFVGGG